MTGPRVETVTFGCRLNIVEFEAMRRHALAAGHRDLTIVNTCAVTAEAVRQSRQAVRRARRLHPTGRLIVTGCAAEIDRAGFADMAGVESVLPNAGKRDAGNWAPVGAPASDLPPPSVMHTRGFVAIQNGCDHRCTFCVIPLGRGASRSLPPAEVVTQIQQLVGQGVRDVVLTGVDLTSYRGNLAGPLTLGGLVQNILASVPDLPRLRLSSIDCIEADPLLLDAFASEPRLMPHLHLSLQSGSNLVLKRMKRRHSREAAIDFCQALRRERPDMVFGADLIAGFPTEDEAMFAESLSLIESCGLTHIHAFPYSPRPGTPAARMPQVHPNVARERGRRLREAGQRRLDMHLQAQIGRQLDVLTERGGKGRTPDFSAVRLPADTNPGRLQRFLVTGHDNEFLIGNTIGH